MDLRARTAFAAGHLPGTLNFELSTNFVTYLGLALPLGAPLTLIGESEQQVADARRELVRIGIDRLAGAAVGDIDALAAGRELRSYPVSDFAGARRGDGGRAGAGRARRAPRRRARRAATCRGSLHIPLHELAERLDEVPDGEVWVYCGSGYRASIAASMLDSRRPSAGAGQRLLRRRDTGAAGRTVCTPSPHGLTGAGSPPARGGSRARATSVRHPAQRASPAPDHLERTDDDATAAVAHHVSTPATLT